MARNNIVIGFKNEADLVRSIAKQTKARAVFASEQIYPAGEWAVSGPANPGKTVIVAANVMEQPHSLFRILLLAEALRTAGAKKLTLVAPWIAYGRQDRAVKPGESPAGLVVARQLSASFNKIVTLDAHSERFIKSFGWGKLVNLLPPKGFLSLEKYDAVTATDYGAHDRAKRIAKFHALPVIQLEKIRHGAHVSTHAYRKHLDGKRILLVDDMADSGSTLFEAARVMREAGAKGVDAFVTHAIDLKALKRKSRGKLGSIHAAFDHANGTYLITILSLLASTAT